MSTESYSIIINDNRTDVILNTYNNRLFLIISQYRKLGSLVSVYKESNIHELNSHVYETKVIFGKDDPEIHAASRYIAEQINIDRPMLISLCLKDFEIFTLRTIIKSIKKKIKL
ncbi:PREDICTED: proteasome assembly chaperone 3-like [Ceratosolen solmsi marchali]|uniref:Proteasome assembly chaperone 3-like n=1 Tax=Ceratosolen solmsi marchali TaxID=326594 RepID=A0AAJ6VL25_9HYME|nr:PREDICTED: proteasome assembly chaperone 3-like [Ceratosolen solmsi marchali]